MAILAGIFSMLGRFAGQLLNTTLGWATLLLFGKVPASRQLLLLVIVFGSLVWVVLVIGVLVPTVGTLLLSGVTVPAFIDLGWIRLAMLLGAIALPAVIGGLAAMVAEKGSRPTGMGLGTSILRGYPFAAVLALIMVELAAVATVRKVRSLIKRWEDTHVPIVVKPGRYDETLRLLSGTLRDAGLDHEVRSAGQLISGPPKLLDLVAGRALGSLVPDELMLLVGPNLEALVYPSDVAISGTKDNVARARAAVSSRLTHVPAYLTTSAEAQRVEDDLVKVRTPADFDRVDKKLAHLTVPFEEWDVLYRKRLQLELEIVDGNDALPAADSASSRRAHATPRPAPLDFAIAGAGLGLIVLDAVLLLTSIRGRRAAGSQQSLRRRVQP
jgi:hypothetical protein